MFSIVVPTCRRNASLAECLERLLPPAARRNGTPFEVIVTDDAPPPNAEPMLKERFPEARWIAGPGRGPAANRNHGARHARGEWIVFCDDDCLPSPDLLDAYARAIAAAPSAQVLEGRIHADRPKRRMDEVSPINESGGYLWSCNFAIRRKTFEALGGFDEAYRFAAMEDVDLRERLRDAGIPIPFVPEASVCHPWRRHGGWSSIDRSVRSHAIFWQRHPDHLRSHPPRAYLRALVRTAIKRTGPELVAMKGRGWQGAALDLLSLGRLAWLSAKMRSPRAEAARPAVQSSFQTAGQPG